MCQEKKQEVNPAFDGDCSIPTSQDLRRSIDHTQVSALSLNNILKESLLIFAGSTQSGLIFLKYSLLTR